MDNSNIPIAQIADTGLTGFLVLLVYNLIQQNKRLFTEVKEHNQVILEVAIRAIDKLTKA